MVEIDCHTCTLCTIHDQIQTQEVTSRGIHSDHFRCRWLFAVRFTKEKFDIMSHIVWESQMWMLLPNIQKEEEGAQATDGSDSNGGQYKKSGIVHCTKNLLQLSILSFPFH